MVDLWMTDDSLMESYINRSFSSYLRSDTVVQRMFKQRQLMTLHIFVLKILDSIIHWDNSELMNNSFLHFMKY